MANNLKIKDPLRRETYSQIIFVIRNGSYNLSQIRSKLKSKGIARSFGTLSPQLHSLYKLDYLKIKNQKKENRTTSEKIYYINWEKISLEFINYLQKVSEKKLLKKFAYINERKWSLKKNQILQNLLKFVIKDHAKYFRNNPLELKTVESLFEHLRVQMISDKTYQEESFKKVSADDEGFANVIELVRNVKKTFSPNFRTSLRKYLNSIRTSKKNN